MNYDTLKFFLRASRLSFDVVKAINSNKGLKEDSNDWSDGLTDKQVKIVEHIKAMELELNESPTISSVKRNIKKLEKLTGQKIPKNVFSTLNIN